MFYFILSTIEKVKLWSRVRKMIVNIEYREDSTILMTRKHYIPIDGNRRITLQCLNVIFSNSTAYDNSNH